MFDYYEPRPPLKCPVCGSDLVDWQGKDGPCALFVWQQGIAAPIGQRVDEESQLTTEERENWRLPLEFMIYSDDCGCSFPVVATGWTHNGVWTITEIVTIDNVKQRPDERRSQFQARRRRLAGKNER